jgi:thiamine biosynthesis lipoprotein
MRPALGTFVEIQCSSQAGLAQGFAAVEKVESLMSFYRDNSDLSRINQAPLGEWVSIHPWTWEVLTHAQELEETSEGIFNVACRGAPSRESGFELRPSGARRRSARKLDLGGIAKGFAVDQAIAAIQAVEPDTQGVVNAGGDLRIFGGTEPVSVGVRVHSKLFPIQLEKGALATSSFPEALSPTATVAAEKAIWADALTKVVLMAPSSVAQTCLSRYQACAWKWDADETPRRL